MSRLDVNRQFRKRDCMTRKLSDMDLEELWQLFPICLEQHNECWKTWYKEELAILQAILPSNVIKRISHIGSTSINTIWAKPTVDILIEVINGYDLQYIANILVHKGYLCMNKSKNRISLNKGYTINGFAEKVYHLHISYEGDNAELYFRDYLIENVNIAKKYEKLKLELWKKYEHNRDAYTDAKTDFIVKYTKQAEALYKNRYR